MKKDASKIEVIRPQDIEKRSFEIIEEEIKARGIPVPFSSGEDSDYEVAFTYHSDNQLERAYDKAEHWVKVGVRP
ncbi:MAG: hypothetical protein IIU07_06520, partial [Lachnospiraceae bacterium]|nr:hypothetical protein [Lachnospiraceae bacterium]